MHNSQNMKKIMGGEVSAFRAALVAAAVCVAMASAPSFAASQYWVGGTSGLWSGENWADAAGGAGGAWTSGDTRGRFTTSPSTIDLNGASPTASDFYTTGFSEANRCAINITNTGETPSTITFKSLNRNDDDELGWTDLSFSNVAVVDTSDWGFEIFAGSHVKFNDGATYTKPTANSSGHVYIGDFLARSNTLEIATGGTFTVNDGLYIGCPGKDHVGKALTGVLLVSGGTVNVLKGNIFMGRCNSTGTFKASNGKSYDNINRGTKATSIFEISGGTVNAKNIYMGSIWASGQTYNQKSELRVGTDGVLNLSGGIYAREYGANSIIVDGGMIEANGMEPYYTANGCYRAKNYSVTVKNGGVLAVKSIYFNTLKDYTENVHFDNGTFRAGGSFSTHAYPSYESKSNNSTLFVVDQGGMTIDTQEYTLTWQTRIDPSSEGKVTKTGSGKLNLNWTTYNAGGFDVDEGTLSFGGTDTQITSGTLTVKSGATLEKQTGNNPEWLAPSVVFKGGAKLNIPYSGGSVGAVSANAITLEGALEVSFSATPAAGAYPLLTILGEGTFDASALEGITLPDDPAFAGAVLSLSADAKSVVLILSSDPVWIGGTSGDLGDPSNWSNGAVPGPTTNAIITAGAAATLTNSASFKATSITFPAGCPKVTIEGAPLTGIEAINNLSSTNHEFKAAVSGDVVTISNTTTYCVFTGGLTANGVRFGVADNTKAAIYGNWHILGDWTPVKGNALHDDASVTVDGVLLNPNNLSIYSGCVVTAATLQATGTCSYFTYNNWGRLVVTGLCSVTTTVDPYFTRNDANDDATVEFGAYYVNSPGKWTYANAKNIIVGAGGMDAATDVNFENARTLYSRTSGFALNSSGGQYLTHKDGLTIDTTQYETELPATVAINGVIRHQSVTRPGKITVTGCGKVLFNSVSTFTGGLTINDTATVAVNAGKKAGNGLVTVNAGATFEVAQSGMVALGGGLALKSGAALAFNYTGRDEPVLDLTGKTVTFDEGETTNVTVRISADAGARAHGGANVLTAGGKFADTKVTLAEGAPDWVKGVSVVDGNIVLDVKPYGMMILVK